MFPAVDVAWKFVKVLVTAAAPAAIDVIPVILPLATAPLIDADAEPTAAAVSAATIVALPSVVFMAVLRAVAEVYPADPTVRFRVNASSPKSRDTVLAAAAPVEPSNVAE
jgi:hypothetical protein